MPLTAGFCLLAANITGKAFCLIMYHYLQNLFYVLEAIHKWQKLNMKELNRI